MGKRILLVEDDTFNAHIVGALLQRRGHEVRHALNGREALETAETFDPHLIITEVVMDELDGFAFVRALRGRPRFAALPVIFLTLRVSDEDRIEGFRLGAEDYLAKPFQSEELGLRVNRVLDQDDRARERAERELARVERSGLEGNLAHLSVSSLLSLFELERKTGLLELRGPEIGRMFLREGRVVAASTDDPARQSGAEAVYRMLRFGRGTFRYTPCEVRVAEEIPHPTTFLLLEAMRRVDDDNLGQRLADAS